MACINGLGEIAHRCCEPVRLYYDIKNMVESELGCRLLSSEKVHMSDSDTAQKLWADFIPLDKSEWWYNVRIGCTNYSIILVSSHKGFK